MPIASQRVRQSTANEVAEHRLRPRPAGSPLPRSRRRRGRAGRSSRRRHTVPRSTMRISADSSRRRSRAAQEAPPATPPMMMTFMVSSFDLTGSSPGDGELVSSHATVPSTRFAASGSLKSALRPARLSAAPGLLSSSITWRHIWILGRKGCKCYKRGSSTAFTNPKSTAHFAVLDVSRAPKA